MNDFRFKYIGIEDTIHTGVLTDISLEKEAESAPHWKHIYPNMYFDDYSKKGLWEEVKKYCKGFIVEVNGKSIQC